MAKPNIILELVVGLEPTWDFSAALQEQCNRRYAKPALNTNKNENRICCVQNLAATKSENLVWSRTIHLEIINFLRFVYLISGNI